MINHARKVTLVAVTLLLATTTGCGTTDKAAPANSTPDKVTYVTGFGAAGRDAYAWVAQEKGYFRDAGLDVKIELGAGTDQNLGALTSGQAQFTAVDLTGSIIDAGKGVFKDVRAFASIHQQTLVSIVSLEGNKVTQPKDLEGKKLGAATASVNQLLFPAYARLAGIDEKKVSWANVAPPQLPALLASGQVSALSTFLIGRLGIEKAAGKKAVILPYSDYLADLYGTSLVTTATTAKQSPDLVKRFRDASLKGLAYALEHPKEAAEIMHKAQPAADVAAATSEMELMAPYVKATDDGGPIGSYNQQRVARAIAILQGAGLIPPGLTPQDVVAFDLAPIKAA
jgi:NitT/TauT family transport system substrate-binding protein